MPKHIFKNTPEDEYYKTTGCKYICEGFTVDVNNLLDEFKEKGSVRYEDFAKIWKERNFDCIFMYREEMEIGFFTDECLKILVKSFVNEKLFTVKAGLLYLIYGIYFRQPTPGRFKIRISLKHLQEFQSFVGKAQNEFHYDMCYIFWSLLHKNAFLFVYRNDIEVDHGYEPASLDRRPIFDQFITEEHIDNISIIHERYSSLKSIQTSSEVKNLSVFDPNIITTFKKKIQNLKRKFEDPDYVSRVTDVQEPEESNVPRNIKNRAFLTTPAVPKCIVSKFVNQPSTSKTD